VTVRQRRKCLAAFLFLRVLSAGAEESPGAGKIPVLLSDHHADHAAWLLGQEGAEKVSLIVVDAHADTAPNAARDRIRREIREGRASDELFQNHNWIEPLVPLPVDSLVWISAISGFPDNEKYSGFIKSTAGWDIPRRCVTLDELDTLTPGGGALFVSIDLDFFYNDNRTPGDIPFVLDRLLDFSRRWTGKVIWAFCVSRAWLPNTEYAWELLEESLAWLSARTGFKPPEFTVFSTDRRDSSRQAEYYRSLGTEPPSLYQMEDEMPDRLRRLWLGLQG
jgi:hypothetical protein